MHTLPVSDVVEPEDISQRPGSSRARMKPPSNHRRPRFAGSTAALALKLGAPPPRREFASTSGRFCGVPMCFDGTRACSGLTSGICYSSKKTEMARIWDTYPDTVAGHRARPFGLAPRPTVVAPRSGWLAIGAQVVPDPISDTARPTVQGGAAQRLPSTASRLPLWATCTDPDQVEQLLFPKWSPARPDSIHLGRR